MWSKEKQIVREILGKIDLMQSDLVQMNEEIRQINIPDSYKGILKFQLKSLDYGIQSHTFAKEWFAGLLKELQT